MNQDYHNPENDKCDLNDPESYCPPLYGNVRCSCADVHIIHAFDFRRAFRDGKWELTDSVFGLFPPGTLKAKIGQSVEVSPGVWEVTYRVEVQATL